MKAAIFTLVAIGMLGTAKSAWAISFAPDGASGLVIWVFLAYCALVVVAQLMAALKGLRSLMEEWTERKKKAKRVALR
ncbi:MAG: hypothetical protein AB7F21_02065 [Desulfuromonadales bacterium]|jgi:hypothetical protein|uniref:hypothetical protein n=1 Tax=Desulfuromonas sp. KJ2020 TaxID=2919173 RepID=UPI0020A74EED|nr:hypothetical protein [Desulfuromonas sp. KJ2020]MCP3175775.1 hypothetical protein [Desulfuromonas sp. KJ2020]